MTAIPDQRSSMVRRAILAAALLQCGIVAASIVRAEDADRGYHVSKDIRYATVNGKELRLDLYMPEKVTAPPLLVWIHGGQWANGSKDPAPLGFVQSGIATASVDFRQSGEARFPAQVYDIKAAIRFLRAAAARYGYRKDRIAIAGASSGAHLAVLVGVTSGLAALEGQEGDNLDQSSSVQAIVDFYGPTNLMTILPQSTPHGLGIRVPALDKLLGGQPEAVPDLAKLASSVTHVDASDPPLLILHGDQDPQVPVNQSLELQWAYERFRLPVTFDVVHGAGHGGPVFYDQKHTEEVVKFIRDSIGR